METYESKLDKLMEMIEKMMIQNQNSNYSPERMDSPEAQGPTTVGWLTRRLQRWKAEI